LLHIARTDVDLAELWVKVVRCDLALRWRSQCEPVAVLLHVASADPNVAKLIVKLSGGDLFLCACVEREPAAFGLCHVSLWVNLAEQRVVLKLVGCPTAADSLGWCKAAVSLLHVCLRQCLLGEGILKTVGCGFTSRLLQQRQAGIVDLKIVLWVNVTEALALFDLFGGLLAELPRLLSVARYAKPTHTGLCDSGV